MKKIILFFTLVSATFAYQYDAKFYIGVGGGEEVENYTNTDPIELDSTSASFGTIKFGYGDQKAYAIEFSLNYIANDNHVFSTSDQAKYSLDINFIKAYPLTTYFYPFIKAGFGAGEMDVDKATLGEGDIDVTLTTEQIKLNRKRLSYSSYNIGFGAFFPVNKNFDFELSYLYRYNSYQSLDYIDAAGETQTLKTKSHINQIYFGFNTRF